MSSKLKELYWSVDSSPTVSIDPLIYDAANTRPHVRCAAAVPQSKKKISRRSTLKTLCAEDKQKVRLLIEDLAKTGAEKDAIEHLLKKERNEFDQKLTHLKLEQQNLLEERSRLEQSLQDSEMKLQTIRSESDKIRSIPAYHSAPVGTHVQWSHDRSAPPTTLVNLDHSLNYMLHSVDSNAQPNEPFSSSSSCSPVSSLHTADLTSSQQLLNQQPPVVSASSMMQPHPQVHNMSHSQVNTEPRPLHALCRNADVATQTNTMNNTAVQTDQHPAVPAIASDQSMLTSSLATSDHKLEQMMTTALLNAKDTVDTIETLSKSLMLGVSRESSLNVLPLNQMTSTQRVSTIQGVTIPQVVTDTQRVNVQGINYQDTNNAPEHAAHPMDTAHVSTSDHKPTSHVDHVITPPQHSYTLYDSQKDNSLYLSRGDELQLQDLAETLNSVGPLQQRYSSMVTPSTPSGRKYSNFVIATQPIAGQHVDHHSERDSDVINDLFFIQW